MTEMSDDAPLRILVPLDGTPQSQHALPYAQALATSGTAIVLLEVLPEPEPERGLLGNVTKSADVVGQRRAQVATAALESIASRMRLQSPGAEISVAVAVGSADEILRTAHVQRIDLIVMATFSRNPVSRLVLGSVTDRIVRSADIPVLVIRPQDAGEMVSLRRLVVPLDGSELANSALRFTERLARQTMLPVHLVTVAGKHDGQAIFRIKRHFQRLSERGIRVTVEILDGAPVAAIQEATEAGDLIVMASHHRAGLNAWVLHGVAELLISHAPCPVLLTPDVSRVTAAAT